MLRRHLVPSCLALSLGCGHAASAARHDAPVRAACEPGASQRGADEPAALYQLSFRLRTDGERGAWIAPGRELYAFSLGPWECALGPEQALDQVSAQGVRLERGRRLACTHRSGATVQSELHCSVPQPATASAASALRRELALALSAAPDLHIACDLGPVSRLEIIRATPGEAAMFCLVGQTLEPCPSVPAPAAREREQAAR